VNAPLCWRITKYENHDIAAALASSSFTIDAMVVVPCSMKTLAASRMAMRQSDLALC